MENKGIYRVSSEKIEKVLTSEEFIKEYFLKRDELLFQAKLSQGQSFSKYTFATAAVALSASLTLVKLFDSLTSFIFLGFAWFFFSLAIIFSLLSILASMDAMEQQIKILKGENKTISIGDSIDFLNCFTLLFISIGLIFTLVFSWINLDRSASMKRKETEAKRLEELLESLYSKRPEKLEKIHENTNPLSLLIEPDKSADSKDSQNSNSSNSSEKK